MAHTSLEQMLVRELRALAAERGVPGRSKMTRAELIAALSPAAEAPEVEPAADPGVALPADEVAQEAAPEAAAPEAALEVLTSASPDPAPLDSDLAVAAPDVGVDEVSSPAVEAPATDPDPQELAATPAESPMESPTESAAELPAASAPEGLSSAAPNAPSTVSDADEPPPAPSAAPSWAAPRAAEPAAALTAVVRDDATLFVAWEAPDDEPWIVTARDEEDVVIASASVAAPRGYVAAPAARVRQVDARPLHREGPTLRTALPAPAPASAPSRGSPAPVWRDARGPLRAPEDAARPAAPAPGLPATPALSAAPAPAAPVQPPRVSLAELFPRPESPYRLPG